MLPATWEAAGNPEGTFTMAAMAGPGAWTTCRGLDIRSVTVLRRLETCRILLVNSAT